MLKISDAVPDAGLQAAELGADPAALRDASAILVSKLDEIRLGTVLDALPAAIYTTDAAGRVTYCNRAAVELVGREPELGTDEWCVTWRLYNPDGTPLPHDQCPMAVALRENRPVRGIGAILERPDGTRIPFLPYPTPLRDPSGALVGAVNMLVDIKGLQDAETARAYLAAIIESSDDAIVSKDLNGVVTSWNRGAEAIFGYRAGEMIGRPISVLFPPDRLQEEDRILAQIRRGERVEHFETMRRHKDGRDIDVSLTISPVRDHCGRIIGVSKIARDISERKEAETALREFSETLERRVAERTKLLADANERLMAEVGERERTEAVLQQAQKMEVVGQLASGIAHDFNNLLAAILGNLELLEMRVEDERLLKLVQAAARSARRGAKLNQQMLAFSRKQYLAPAPIDLNELIFGMQEMLRRTLGGMVEIVPLLPADLWPALVDANQLEMVVLNLAINARDAMPLGGRLSIEGKNVKASEVDKSAELAPGDYVAISVTDTGTGMPAAVLARACEPFFTTKELGKGSGLGLAQVYGVAQQSGGGVQIKSIVGQGTTVELYLPRSLAQPHRPREPERNSHRHTRNRRASVLVVDDNEEVREVIAAQLELLGYQVAQAASGQTALELLGGNSGGVDLLIADYAMPQMCGTELARAARSKRPNLPVVIITGYIDTTSLDDRMVDAVLLRKPFRISELAATVERALQNDGNSATVMPLKPASRRAGSLA